MINMNFDTFVAKVSLHNKLLSAEDLAKATAIQGKEGGGLLNVLCTLDSISKKDAERIRKAYQKKGGTLPEEGPAVAVFVPQGEPASAPVVATKSEQAGSLYHHRESMQPVVATEPIKPQAFVLGIGADNWQSLDELLAYVRAEGASDVHITNGASPWMRLHGKVVQLPKQPATAAENQRLLFSALNEEEKAIAKQNKCAEKCYITPDGGRFRCCIYKQRLGWDGAFRVVDKQVASFAELDLPPALQRLTEYPQGMVLITGPGGCGKSTTLAAMVELINQSRDEHIITIEDPVEVIFEITKAHINQRQVGTHTDSYSAALRAALREDPDVIVIGELRDKETASLAISAAETGHLVFATLHTTSAISTVNRLLNFFEPEEQSQVRSMISESIRGIVCQRLLPQRSGEGQVMALEVLLNNVAVGSLIREERLFQLPSLMLAGKSQGMCLMDDSLQKLRDDDAISAEQAWLASDDEKRFPHPEQGGEA